MDEPLHDIDKLFLDNIEGHTEYPPNKVWDNIEAGLDKTSAVVYKKKYEKTKRAALILLLLIAGILIYEVASINKRKNNRSENALKESGEENVAVQTNNDATKTSAKQNEKITVLPGADSGLESNKQDAAVNNQDDKTDIKEVTKQDDSNNVATDAGKNKISQNKQQTGSAGIPDAPVKDVASNKNIDGKDDNNLTANNASPNKRGKKQNITPLPVIEEQKYRRLAPVTENNKQQEVPGILKQPAAFDINSILKLPVIALAHDPAKENAKPAQKNIRINASKPGLYLSFFVSPNVTWNSIENDKPHSAGGGGNHVEDHNAIKKEEHNNFSYTAGLKLGYNFNKNLAVQTGLNYTSAATSIDPKLIFADRDNNGAVRYRLDCSSGYSFLLPANGQSPNSGDSLVVNDSRNTLAYAGIPLAIEYKFITGKVSLSATVGGQANILVKGKTTTTFGKGTATETSVSGNTQALKSTYFSAVTGITGELKLNKKLSLTVTPAGQLGLTSINKGGSVKTHSNNFSVGAGLKLRL